MPSCHVCAASNGFIGFALSIPCVQRFLTYMNMNIKIEHTQNEYKRRIQLRGVTCAQNVSSCYILMEQRPRLREAWYEFAPMM